MATRALNEIRGDLADRIDKAAVQMQRPHLEIVEEALSGWLDTEDWKHRATIEAMAQARAGQTIDSDRASAFIRSLGSDQRLPLPGV